MPELPEVEITRRGITPHILGNTVERVVVRNAALRWPVPRRLARELKQCSIDSVKRRAKYLLLGSRAGTVILHLGMSGSLRVLPVAEAAQKHDHVDLVFSNKICLRLRDPRRFGAVLWTHGAPEKHKLLRNLGPEPLSRALDGEYLYQKSRGRRVALRNFLLDSRVVAGIGNIYANEAAFLAGVLPQRAAGRISHLRYQQLTSALKQVLRAAIRRGGTTLRDFQRSDGRPGYFGQELNVYGRQGEPCPRCQNPVVRTTLAARSLFYCPNCQT